MTTKTSGNWKGLEDRMEGMRKVVNKYDILIDATNEEIYKDLNNY